VVANKKELEEAASLHDDEPNQVSFIGGATNFSGPVATKKVLYSYN
jgi:hypothetical protein